MKKLFLVLSLFFLTAKISFSQEVYTPSELKEWSNWIREAHPEWQCAKVNSGYECAWPGKVSLTISNKEGQFALDVEVLNETWLPLPSNTNFQPVKIEVKTAKGDIISPPIDKNENGLFIKLQKGSFHITGNFIWDSPPNELPLPDSYGMLELKSTEDSNLKFKRNDSQIWIESERENSSVNSLGINVFRLINDNLPLEITTLIRLKISGQARSINLGKVLPLNSTPIKIITTLTNHLSTDGELVVQVSPGEYDLMITSVMQQPVTEISLAENKSGIWPTEEIWTIQNNPSFRIIEISGGKSIPADITELPEDWKNGTILAVSAQENKISFKEIARGEQNIIPNNTSINRELWLDMNGKGFTSVDKISGTASKEFRLNVLSETQLGRVDVNGKQRLVTIDPQTQSKGVELRETAINVQAVSRIEQTSSFSAVGWNFDANNISMKLNLPPSWKLFHVTGAQDAYNSWTGSWDLMQIFIAILIILSSYKIFNKKIALLVLATTFLNHGEFLAPNSMFINVLILSAIGLLLPDKTTFWGKTFHRLLIITTGIWLFQVITFEKLQFTQFLYPQLEAGTRYRTIIQSLLITLNSSFMNWIYIIVALFILIAIFQQIAKFKNAFLRAISYLIVIFFACSSIAPLLFFGSSYQGSAPMRNMSQDMAVSSQEMAAPSAEEYSSNVIVGGLKRKLRSQVEPKKEVVIQEDEQAYSSKSLQSGPAVPAWNWRSFYITLSAPVSADHKISLMLISPMVNKIIILIRMLVLALLAIHILKTIELKDYLKSLDFALKKSVAIVILLGCSLFASAKAYADTPSPELLKELEQRISNKLCQRETCAQITKAEIEISKDIFKIRLEVTSDGKSSVDIPGPLTALFPNAVKLNGNITNSIKRKSDDFLSVMTNDGSNIIEIQGISSKEDSFAVTLPSTPLVIKVNAPDYFVEGLLPNQTAPNGLRFTKILSNEDKTNLKKPIEKTSLPYWVIANREFSIGSKIQIETTVERIGDLDKPFETQVPLLPDEQVISGSIRVENGKALVQFSAQEDSISFQSVKGFSNSFNIAATQNPRFNETWILSCNDHTRCTSSGLLPVSHQLEAKQSWTWNPFPGEEVAIKVENLSAAEGEHLTIDNISHAVTYGLSRTSGVLDFSLRATEQTNFKIGFESGIVPEGVFLNNQQISVEQNENSATIILAPGNHSISFKYNKDTLMEFDTKIPSITLNNPANNITVTANPSYDRWILWTGGSSWGPCVVFWSKMIIICALCILLARYNLIKSSIFAATFLGIGLSSVSIIVMIIPLAWILLINNWDNLKSHLINQPRAIKLIVLIALPLISCAVFFHIVETGLLLEPPMLITGNGSSAHFLRWFFDHSTNNLEQPYIISLPIYAWRVFSLIWSTWLVIVILSWLKTSVDIIKSATEEK